MKAIGSSRQQACPAGQGCAAWHLMLETLPPLRFCCRLPVTAASCHSAAAADENARAGQVLLLPACPLSFKVCCCCLQASSGSERARPRSNKRSREQSVDGSPSAEDLERDVRDSGMDGPPYTSDDNEEVKHDLALLGLGVRVKLQCVIHTCCWLPVPSCC